MDREVLESVLIREAEKRTVHRILGMDTEAAVPKGENHLSVITRIRLDVALGSGRTAKRSFILKRIPPEERKVEMIKDMGIFRSETMMYTVVLREMESLMEEFNDTEDVLWAKLFHYEPYTLLLFEDLKASGFKLASRKNLMDLEHGLLLLRSLGRFHGMCTVLQERGVVNKEDYKPYALISDKTWIKIFMYEGLQTMSRAMEEAWGPDWLDAAQKLKVPYDVLEDKYTKLGQIDESRFNVLNHGDCWTNNMMFKYNTENRPYALRFMDFQCCHYNSCCFDLTYALYLNVKPSVRRENYTLLVTSYWKTLVGTLRKFGYLGDRPTQESLLSEMKRLEFFAYTILIAGHAPMTSENEDALDIEELIATNGIKGRSIDEYKSDRVKISIGEDIRFALENGIL